jgi:hypothetical protein
MTELLKAIEGPADVRRSVSLATQGLVSRV